MRKIMNKRGQTVELVSATVLGFMIIIFTIFAVLYGISALNPGSFFAANSANQNATNTLTQNLTGGIQTFSQQIPTVFAVLAVVLVLSGIAVLIIYVRRMAGGGMASL